MSFQLKLKRLAPAEDFSSSEYVDIFVYQQLVDLMLFVTACFQQPIYLRTSYSYQFTQRFRDPDDDYQNLRMKVASNKKNDSKLDKSSDCCG